MLRQSAALSKDTLQRTSLAGATSTAYQCQLRGRGCGEDTYEHRNVHSQSGLIHRKLATRISILRQSAVRKGLCAR